MARNVALLCLGLEGKERDLSISMFGGVKRAGRWLNAMKEQETASTLRLLKAGILSA